MSEIMLKVEERLKETEELLDKYSTSVGLDSIGYNEEVATILKLDSLELKNLTSDEALTYGYMLCHYSGFLSKEIGRQKSILGWANHNLGVIIGKVYDNYGDKWMKYEVKKVLVCADNEYAQALSKIILKASSRIDQLGSIDYQVSKMADFLKLIGNSKRYNNEH